MNFKRSKHNEHSQLDFSGFLAGEIASWTDNKSLVKKASKMLKRKVHVPANTIALNWDALKTMVDAMHELEADGIKVIRKWVR